jgi:hypothetical protein
MRARLLALSFVSLLAAAQEPAPEGFPPGSAWRNGGLVSNVSVEDFRRTEILRYAVVLRFEQGARRIVVFLDDASTKYSDRKKRVNLSFLLPESSAEFRNVPSGAISNDIYFGDEPGMPQKVADLNERLMEKLLPHMAEALARDLPGFVWKSKDQALVGLRKMRMRPEFYVARVLRYVRVAGRRGGGIMTFEILHDHTGKAVGSRVTEELLID